MKDIISAISASVAVVVLMFCFVENVDVETAVLRALISFICSFLLGYSAWIVFKVQMDPNSAHKKESDEKKDDENRAEAPAEA